MFGLEKKDDFFNLLKLAVGNVHEGATAFLEMVEDYTEIEKKFDFIQGIEHKGDALTRNIMQKLHKSFQPPIDREDISAIAFTLDEIIDRITGVADRCVLYRIEAPTPEIISMAKAMVGATGELVKLIGTLRKVKYDRVKELSKNIKKWEEESDNIYRQAVASLLNDDKNAIDVIKWKEIYEKMEDGVDFCKDVSNLVEGVVLKHL